MHTGQLAILLAVTTLLMVGVALGRHVLVHRAMRRDLDRYLRWLLDEAAGPLDGRQPQRCPRGRRPVHSGS